VLLGLSIFAITTVRLNDPQRARDQVLAWVAGRSCLVPI